MRTVKPLKRSEHSGFGAEFYEDAEVSDEEMEAADLFRVVCPDCTQPIALAAPGTALPEHALCPTPWNPFGLTVCAGSGRMVADEKAAAAPVPRAGHDTALLASLPESLDWRLQPFSHATPDDAALRQAA